MRLVPPSRPVRAWVFSLLIFLASLAWYLATLTHVHTFDALSYVLDIDRKPWQEVFHPHHLAYGPLGEVVRHTLHALGWSGSVLLPLQVVNAVAGALGVALFAALVADVTRRRDLALCGAVLLGASYAYWYYAVEVEVYTIAALFLVGCLWLLVRVSRRPTLPLCVALGLSQGMAVLFHQTNVLLCVPVILALLSRDGRGAAGAGPAKIVPPSRAACVLAYALSSGVVVIGSYLLVGFGISGFRSLAAFGAWTTAYAHTGWWGGAVTSATWADLGKGLADTVAQPDGALLGLLLVGLLVLYLRHLVLAYGRLALLLVVWLVVYGAFFLWWEPDNIEFWIASLPPFLLLLLLAVAAAVPRWHPGVWAILALGVTIAAINYDSIVRRGTPSYDAHHRLAFALARQSAPDDTLLVPDEMLELSLRYYDARDHAQSLNQALFESGGNWASACVHMQQMIDQAMERGAAVIIGEGVLYPAPKGTPLSDPLLERAGVSRDQVTACFAPYLAALTPLDMDPSLPTYYRIPSAQELVEGPGWDFSHGRWGWQAVNIRDERFVGGWEFLPGVDPRLISPPIAVDLSRYEAVEMGIQATAATTVSEKIELFALDERGQVDLNHAIQRTLKRGSSTETYRIGIAGREGWSGKATGFRLDPIGEGDGGRVRVEWFRLIPKAGSGENGLLAPTQNQVAVEQEARPDSDCQFDPDRQAGR